MKNQGNRPERLALGAAVLAVVFLLVAMAQQSGEFTNAKVFLPVWLAAIVTLLSSLVAWGRYLLRRRELEEAAQLRDYLRQEGRTDLFDDSDEAVKLAKRASAHYVKYFAPVFAVLLGVGTFLAAWWQLRVYGKVVVADLLPGSVHGGVPMCSLALIMAVVALLPGNYYIGSSRETGMRWLRPIGAWLLVVSVFFAIAGLATLYFKDPVADLKIAKGMLVALEVLGVEMLVGFVIEFYRPRSPGEEERPLHESRLLNLVTEPGGVAKNVAESLDYQFGFQVSEGKFYQTLERVLLPSLLFVVGALWLLTCLVQVNASEQGIRENFGRVADRTPLPPGMYFKWPAPFSRIRKFNVSEIHQAVVSSEVETGHEEGKEDDHKEILVLWSQPHGENIKDTPFIVALRPEASTVVEPGSSAPVSVYFMTANIPVSYKIKDVYQFAYANRNADDIFFNLAYREISAYMARHDFNEVLTSYRKPASEELRARIQKVADEFPAASGHGLGVEIVTVGLEEIHPPTEVGLAFDQVTSARIEKETSILNGQVAALKMKPAAETYSTVMKTIANSYKDNTGTIAQAEAQRYLCQLEGFRACPEVFKMNHYLEAFEESFQSARKYVVAAKTGKETVTIDTKEAGTGMVDIPISAPVK